MDQIVKKDIEAAKNLIHSKSFDRTYSKYSQSFLFGTENQEGIDHIIHYKDQEVFTVASSGDQYISSIYYGAMKSDVFDINRLTYYVTILKIASIMVLDYDEFISFFVPVHKETVETNFWSLKTLKRILYVMPRDVAYFWENIMYECKRKECYGSFVNPTGKYSNLKNIIKGMPFYAQKEEYYRLQSLLRTRRFPRFYEADVLNLGQIMVGEYDIIYLSNIIECLVATETTGYSYPFGYVDENRIEADFILKIAKETLPHLKEGGMILFDYRPNKGKNDAMDLLFQNDFFDVNEVESKISPSGENGRTEATDLVLTYCPKKKGNILYNM